MKISVIIPHYEVSLEKRKLLLRFLESIAGQYTELIIIAEKRENLASKINEGLKKANGDYIIVSNDDCQLIKGTLKDLCIKDVVSTPKAIGSLDKLFHGYMWAYSKEVLKKVGFMWEGYDGFYFDDSDYWLQIEKAGVKIIKVQEIEVLHDHPSSTLRYLFKEGREEKNRQIFISRWGISALNKIL